MANSLNEQTEQPLIEALSAAVMQCRRMDLLYPDGDDINLEDAVHFEILCAQLIRSHGEELLAMVNDQAVGDRSDTEAAGCGQCHACLNSSGDSLAMPGSHGISHGMILCPDCGNKRCPKASDHTLACTGSNAPGQPGSRFAATLATKGNTP